MLGTCPTLAVTVSIVNGVAMGLATTFVFTFQQSDYFDDQKTDSQSSEN